MTESTSLYLVAVMTPLIIFGLAVIYFDEHPRKKKLKHR